jgi:phosphotransferase system enzyme I (PtsP)
LPPETIDGQRISLQINAGLLVDVQHLAELDADGVGLYRTEIPFMVRSEMPNVEMQRALYRKVLTYACGKPVVFRTLDVGGDKVMPFWDHGRDENPAMGWRAIRVSFDRPAVLRQQLRALIQAAAGQDLYVMFPMIAEVGEFHFGRNLLNAEIARIEAMNGELPRQIKVGAMLEVPALLFQLPGLLAQIDFLSVGTNDLFQFLFASDRGNYRISERYDVLSPVAFRVLKSILEECEKAGVAVSLCGEMAGRPLDAMALLGLGFRTLSLAPPSLGAVKAMLRTVHLGLLQEFIDSLCSSEQRSVRDHLRCFAQDHHVLI